MPQKQHQLIARLELGPHPEGGWYREIFRSTLKVDFHGQNRCALTNIFYLLEKGQQSRWHVVDGDEVWHYYEGQGMELYLMPPDFSELHIIQLGEAESGFTPVHLVRAGWWQAARPKGDYAFCGCTVAPGFEYSGFRLLSDEEKQKIRLRHPKAELLF
jgi:uncharacterized protein